MYSGEVCERTTVPPLRHHSPTCANMATLMQTLQLFFLLAVVSAEPAPAPGRIPKVYNALITSNQNLEPSKAYPVYQPVLHDFAFPYQPVFYGDYPIANGVQHAPPASPKDPNLVLPAAPLPEQADTKAAPTEASAANPAPSDAPQEASKPTSAPPLPPNTQSPIPLNQFGLPPQVLPLGRIDPAYNGFNQIGPFRYTYPSLRFYDPFDPFSFNPYVNFPPLYRPLSNVLEASGPVFASAPSVPRVAVAAATEPPSASAPVPASQPSQSPPPEPSDLSVLNYSSNDPAIPNVPPPPLPQGGLKPDNSE